MAKYETLTALAIGFRKGDKELKGFKLMLDNDSSHLAWFGDVPDDEDAAEVIYDQKLEEGKNLFSAGRGYEDLEEACEAAGIPCEGV